MVVMDLGDKNNKTAEHWLYGSPGWQQNVAHSLWTAVCHQQK